MEKTISIIVGIVVIAFFGFAFYSLQQHNLRQKELDKKKSDCLEQDKQINDLIIEKLKSNEINLMSTDNQQLTFQKQSSNGNKKKKNVTLTKN